MTNLLRHITQDEFNRIGLEFLDQTGMFRGTPYYQFYASIQKTLLDKLQQEFITLGYKLERVVKDPEPPHLVYQVVDKAGKPVVSQNLDFTFLLYELIYINANKFPGIPDVKLVVPEYLDGRIKETVDGVRNSFQDMLVRKPEVQLKIKRGEKKDSV